MFELLELASFFENRFKLYLDPNNKISGIDSSRILVKLEYLKFKLKNIRTKILRYLKIHSEALLDPKLQTSNLTSRHLGYFSQTLSFNPLQTGWFNLIKPNLQPVVYLQPG